MSSLEATAFAPASVGNIGVGFDLLGHSIAGPGDRVRVRQSDKPGVRIGKITGCVRGLPLDAEKNTASAALIALCDAGLATGFEIEIDKGIPLGSGLGGSAASCVAALVAANALLQEPLSREELYPFALDGESVASGSRHGDNVGPTLLGGIVLALGERLIRLPTPQWLYCVVTHPDQVLETRRSREALAAPYPIGDFVRQSSNLAQFLLGLERGDKTLIAAGLRDDLVEPRRAPLIPGFDAVTNAARAAGCLGTSISGGGPSIFAWFDSEAKAAAAAPAMMAAFGEAGIDSKSFVSPVAGPRAELL
jgi:homoserine kinase